MEGKDGSGPCQPKCSIDWRGPFDEIHCICCVDILLSLASFIQASFHSAWKLQGTLDVPGGTVL